MTQDIAAARTGDLIACLNHDIRTAMNGVAGMLALLLDSGLTQAQRQLAADAQHCADNLMALLENIVDFSMIEAGGFALARHCFDLRETLQAACALPQAAARDNGLELSLHLPPALMLRGDAARLRQIVGNLLNVAIVLTADGRIDAEIAVTKLDDERCRVQVTISGPAQALDERQLCDMLNLPDQADPAAMRAHGRSALELALCKWLARLMEAKIEVRSEAGRPALCFSVELACAPSATAGMRTLLMMQDGADLEALAAQLHAAGMRVETFDTVTAALAALGQAGAGPDPFRIALLGERIQGMDCEVLGAAIKADAAYRDVRLVALSAWPRAGDQPDLAQAGFSAVIAMPPRREQTLAVVNTLCEAMAGGRASQFIHPGDDCAPRAGAQSFAGRRILVADDNPVNRQVAQRMATNLGCQVDVAVDGEQAVAMHAARPYDLILMDCQMPRLDGYQATARIRALDGSVRRTPVIAVTARAAQGEREHCLSSGMDDFIAKPVRPQLLAEVIGRWLAGAAPAPASDGHAACPDELDVVRDMFGADFAELAGLYQKDSPPRIATLRQAGAVQDYAQVAKVAHALSGSSVSIGATGLSSLCKELELRAKASELDDFAARLATIEAEYDRISARLRSMTRSKVTAA